MRDLSSVPNRWQFTRQASLAVGQVNCQELGDSGEKIPSSIDGVIKTYKITP